MTEEPLVLSLKDFIKAEWNLEAPADTFITLYRGQRRTNTILPGLFRPPVTADQALELEQKLLARFKAESPFLLPSAPISEWDWLSLAQHYGIPTRLSDWSSNPLVGLFFAVERDKTVQEKPLSPVVYVYYARKEQLLRDIEKVSLAPTGIQHHRILQPSAHSFRVAMQAGWHLAHKFETQQQRIVPLQEMERHRKLIRSIQIDPASVQRIRSELSIWGIKHATVFGDLGAVAASIRRELGLR